MAGALRRFWQLIDCYRDSANPETVGTSHVNIFYIGPDIIIPGIIGFHGVVLVPDLVAVIIYHFDVAIPCGVVSDG